MKYIILVRGFNEPDNNTPSDEVYMRVYELEPEDVAEKVKEAEEYFETDFNVGVEAQAIPVERVSEGWEKVIEIW